MVSAAGFLALMLALPAGAQSALEQLKAMSPNLDLMVPASIMGTVVEPAHAAASTRGRHRAVQPGLYNNADGSPIIPFINQAQATLDIEIYQMDDHAVRNAIRDALRRGVRVRIIKEPDPVGGACKVFAKTQTPGVSADPLEAADCADQQMLVRQVNKAGGRYIPFNKAGLCAANQSCLEHGKIAISDGGAALMSTGNFDPSNLCDRAENPQHCNRDYTLVLQDADVVGTLEAIFTKDLAGVSYDLSSLISPAAAAKLTVGPLALQPLLAFIRSAQTSILMEGQYLKEPHINDALAEAARRGVRVKVVMASFCSFASPSESEAAAVRSIYSAFDAAGVQSRMFNKSILVAGLPGYMHAKAIVVDGKRAWVGSTNGSTQSLTLNREYGAFVDDSSWVGKLSSIMTGDFNNPNEETWRQSLLCQKDH